MAGSRAVVWRYYLYRISTSYGLYVPYSIIYLQDQGFGLDVIGLAHAAFLFTMVAAEVPTGYVGDRVGRRASLAIGNGLSAVSVGLYPFVDTAGAYVALYAVWAVGWTFHSGTTNAWLYELLAARFDPDEFASVQGRGNTVQLLASAGGALLAAVLYGADPSLPFLANAGLAAMGLPVLATLPATARTGRAIGSDAGPTEAAGAGTTGEDCPPGVDDCPVEEGRPADEPFTVRAALESLRLQLHRPEVRWLVLYAALFNALFSVTRVLEQPAMATVGVPVAGFGVLYAAIKLVSAGAAASAGTIEDRLGARYTFALMAPVYGLVYATLFIAPVLVVPVIFLNRGIAAVADPIRNQYLNDRLGDVGRATVLSGASMVLQTASGASNVLGGYLAEQMGTVPLLATAGVAVALAGGALWVGTAPVRPLGDADRSAVGSD